MAREESWGWYKHYPAKFIRGVRGLGPEAIGAYAVILDLIYDDEESCPNDPKWIAGILGCSARKAIGLIDLLVKAGKLHFTEDGRLGNHRAEIELENRSKVSREARETGSRGGRTSAENREVMSKTKDLFEDTLKGIEENRIEEKREEEAPIGAIASEPPSSKKGTRWPADRDIPEEWFASAAARRAKAGLPVIDLRAEAQNFVSYWPSVPGAKGVKLDWKLTFENSCLRARAPVTPYPRFGVVQGGVAEGYKPTTISGWVDRLAIYHGFDEGCPKGTWLKEQWGAPPGEKDCRVRAESFTLFQARYGKRIAL